MHTLEAGTIKRIHVDRHVLAHNVKHQLNNPAYTIQTSKGPIKASFVRIHGSMTFDQAKKPLSCGARMYGETTAEVQYA